MCVLCADVDECEKSVHDCSIKARCVNQEPSYTCTCHAGYRGDGHQCSSKSTVCNHCVVNLHQHYILFTVWVIGTLRAAKF